MIRLMEIGEEQEVIYPNEYETEEAIPVIIPGSDPVEEPTPVTVPESAPVELFEQCEVAQTLI